MIKRLIEETLVRVLRRDPSKEKNMEWESVGQIHLTSNEFEVKIWKPSEDFVGWFWSCEKLGIERRFTSIEDEEEGKKSVLRLVADEVDLLFVELQRVKYSLDKLLSEETE